MRRPEGGQRGPEKVHKRSTRARNPNQGQDSRQKSKDPPQKETKTQQAKRRRGAVSRATKTPEIRPDTLKDKSKNRTRGHEKA